MQFLYPKSRQFPFDEVGEQIVRALEARAWKVPGLSVEFRTYGSGAQKLRIVSAIQSDQSAIDLGLHDVRIEFGRGQGTLPGGQWNDTAAVCEVRLPCRALRVYEDESGPTYYVYVGDSWERDRSTWWSRPNARLNNEPRVCVKYSGRSYGRAATLEWDKDDREYGPEGKEPRSVCTRTIMEGVRVYLHDVLLPVIEEYPVVAPEVDEEPPPIPMPAGFGPLFAYGEGRDVRRIELGKKCIDELRLADRYGMSNSGYRLAPLGSIKRGPDLPEIAFDGFLWCGTIGTAGWRVPGEHYSSCADHLIKVTPKDARGIYVADHAVYEKRRAELSAAITDGRNSFTNAEVNDFIRARACTIVPLAEYKGGYEDPVYLINRELNFDEVEVIGTRPDRRVDSW